MKKLVIGMSCFILIITFCEGQMDPLEWNKIKTRKIVPEHSNEIMASYDPNFVKVENVFGRESKKHFIQYGIGFEKPGSVLVKDIKITVSLPNDFKLANKSNVLFFLDSQPYDVEAYPSWNGKVQFTIHNVQKFKSCWSDSSENSCKGYLIFCTYTKDEMDLKQCETNIRLYNPVVYFDDNPVPISRFEDKLSTDIPDGSCLRITSDTCDCDCHKNGPWLLIVILIVITVGMTILVGANLSFGGE